VDFQQVDQFGSLATDIQHTVDLILGSSLEFDDVFNVVKDESVVLLLLNPQFWLALYNHSVQFDQADRAQPLQVDEAIKLLVRVGVDDAYLDILQIP